MGNKLVGVIKLGIYGGDTELREAKGGNQHWTTNEDLMASETQEKMRYLRVESYEQKTKTEGLLW